MRIIFLSFLALAGVAPARPLAQEPGSEDARARTHFDAGLLHY